VIDSLLGRVVVVAGEEPGLAATAAAAVDAGALVAVVSRTLPADTPSAVRFRTDPADADVWWRIGMHIEQHLGPIDGAATDAATVSTVHDQFEADFVRRGHGHVVAVGPADDAADVVTRLCTPRAAPPRSPHAAPDR
jgi:hypothetical protein